MISKPLARSLQEDYSGSEEKNDEHMQESEEKSSSNSQYSRYKSKHKTDKTPRAWRTSVASGGKMTPIGWRRQPQSGKEDSNAPWQRSHIQETPNEEKEDDSIEAHLRQHAREIANLKGQIAENDYKTETVQRQTVYLLHKNSKR